MHNNVRGFADSGRSLWGKYLTLKRFDLVPGGTLATVHKSGEPFLVPRAGNEAFSRFEDIGRDMSGNAFCGRSAPCDFIN